MGWKNDLERLRDWGKTWGPGVDDARMLTEEEMAEQDAAMEAYRRKLEEYSVAPRKAFVAAGNELKNSLSGGSGWHEEYNKKKIELCADVCRSLGYSLNLGWRGKVMSDNEEEPSFAVSVEYYGWLPNRGGNIHQYFVCGIQDVEDCLQLVADFNAIGAIPTTWYGRDFHYTTGLTGELRNELIRRFGIGVPQETPLEKKLEEAEMKAGCFGRDMSMTAEKEGLF